MLDTTILKYHEILYAIFYQYNRAHTSQICNKLFNACFELADSICLMEQGGFIDDLKLRELSAIYVIKDICKYVQELTDGGETDGEDSLRALHACFEDGRLGNAIPIVRQYFQGHHGFTETIKNPSFRINFERVLTYFEPS